MANSKRGGSPPLTEKKVAKIKGLLRKGYTQHYIAALCGVNQGRVSEINTGKRSPAIKPDDSQQAFPF